MALLLDPTKNSKANDRYIPWITGLITSSLPRIKYGGLHYKHLEKDKINALKKSKAHLMQKCIFPKRHKKHCLDTDKKRPSRIIY